MKHTFQRMLLRHPDFNFRTSAKRRFPFRNRQPRPRPSRTIDGFGASDAWSMQHIGLWPDSVRLQTADWLFSTENDSKGATPRASGFRYGVSTSGQAAITQGRESGIGSHRMRTGCFLRPDGTYDWTQQPGQRNFLRMAQERGVRTFIGFFNSPPVYFTQNGLATNTGRGGTLNLKTEHYGDFALFAANVVKGLEQHDGIKLSYVCPVNEPDGHWNWVGPKQEGTPATNREIAGLARAFSQAFTRKGLDTKILINESSDYRCMFATHMTDWQRGYAIQSFSCPDSTDTYLGRHPERAAPHGRTQLLDQHSLGSPTQHPHATERHVGQIQRAILANGNLHHGQ